MFKTNLNCFFFSYELKYSTPKIKAGIKLKLLQKVVFYMKFQDKYLEKYLKI